MPVPRQLSDVLRASFWGTVLSGVLGLFAAVAVVVMLVGCGSSHPLVRRGCDWGRRACHTVCDRTFDAACDENGTSDPRPDEEPPADPPPEP